MRKRRKDGVPASAGPPAVAVSEGDAVSREPGSKYRLALQLLLSLAIAIGIIEAGSAFLPIPVPGREGVVRLFTHRILWIIAAHVLAAFGAAAIFKRRATYLVTIWIVTITSMALLGGFHVVEAGVDLAILAAAAILFGRLVLRRFPAETNRIGVALATGISIASILIAYLALAGELTRITVTILLLLFLLSGAWFERATILSSVRESFRRVREQTLSWESIVFGEWATVTFSILAIFAYAPDRGSDSGRVYIPYLNLLRHFGGFFDIPQLWSYVIPQAPIAFMSLPYIAFGSVTARFTMLLCALATVLIIHETRHAWAGALAVLALSTPLIFLLASSQMLDMYSTLIVVLLAFVCIEFDVEKSPPALYWALIGMLAGLCWTAKYSTLPYAGMAGLIALVRAYRHDWRRHLASSIVVTPIAAALSAAPWLVHTYRETGNPFFPFFGRIFSSPLWDVSGFRRPTDPFQYPKDWRIAIAPIEFTFHTQNYVESVNGGIGVVLLILLALAIVGLFDRNQKGARAWFLVAIVATAALCVASAYIRYWMVAFFLLAPCAAAGAKRLGALTVTVLISGGILLSIPIAMSLSWGNPTGLPWDYYRHRITFVEELKTRPGVEAFQYLASIDPAFPKVWCTDVNIAGYFPVVPLEALAWEFARMHGLNTPAEQTKWLESVNADYWIVNTNDKNVRRFNARVKGIFFRPEYKIFSDGVVDLYRMPKSLRAARAAAAAAKAE